MSSMQQSIVVVSAGRVYVAYQLLLWPAVESPFRLSGSSRDLATFSSPSITSFQRGVYDPIQRNGELDDVQPTQVFPAQSDTSDEFDNTFFNTDDNVCDLEEPTCYEHRCRNRGGTGGTCPPNFTRYIHLWRV